MKVLDLFCGAGGFSEGFRQAGFDIMGGVDNWHVALQSFHQNFPDAHAFYQDVGCFPHPNGPFQYMDVAEVDVIIGSPPCQEFSVANRERTCDTSLIDAFFDVVELLRPDYWAMEEVPPVKPFLGKYLQKHKGRAKILNAADFGVPQKRKRCIATNFGFPFQTHSQHWVQTVYGVKRKPWVTVSEALGDSFEPIERVLSNTDIVRLNQHRERIGLLPLPDSFDEPSRTILASQGKRTEKGIYLNVEQLTRVSTFRESRGGFDDPQKPSRTIKTRMGTTAKTNDEPYFFDGKGIRPLTWREASKLQSFPSSFYFHGSKADKYTQIGNAVPPLLAKAIAKAIPA